MHHSNTMCATFCEFKILISYTIKRIQNIQDLRILNPRIKLLVNHIFAAIVCDDNGDDDDYLYNENDAVVASANYIYKWSQH